MENVTDNIIAGVPQGAICVATDAYVPSGLMQNLCDHIEAMNSGIEVRYPGLYPSGSLTVENINLDIKLKPVVRGGEGIPHVVINVNPDHDPFDPSSPTHIIVGDPEIPITLDCSKNEDGSFTNASKIESAYNQIMQKLRERIERWERRRGGRAAPNTQFGVTTTYTADKNTTDPKRRRVIVDMGPETGVIISRPYTQEEAPSLFIERN